MPQIFPLSWIQRQPSRLTEGISTPGCVALEPRAPDRTRGAAAGHGRTSLAVQSPQQPPPRRLQAASRDHKASASARQAAGGAAGLLRCWGMLARLSAVPLSAQGFKHSFYNRPRRTTRD
ncbi:unnamed protein product [Rangifer tarandus platyrhynchus]|uniref:Uncharacterized protein n=1 Tax=Rangifer tarandus platyrhynchus TaxID=3082113 RepID=A0AC59YL08_RANTA